MRAADHQTALRSIAGFTLMEVMVALVLGTLIVGGVMGLISVSLQYNHRLDRRIKVQPVLEAAAQSILIHPEKARDGSKLVFEHIANAPPVDVALIEVAIPDNQAVANRSARLYRVQLHCQGQWLEFSVLIPRSLLE